MDKRTLLALALMALVIVVTPRIFSSRSAAPPRADSTAVTSPAPANSATAVTQAPAAAQARADTSPQHAVRAITQAATLTTPRASFALMNPGAAPGDVTLPAFRDLRPGERKGSSVVIAPAGRLQFVYRLANGRDTIALDTLPFTVAQTPSEVTFSSAAIRNLRRGAT